MVSGVSDKTGFAQIHRADPGSYHRACSQPAIPMRKDCPDTRKG
jgi:hypothetical protein